ncbi:MAG: hypothetical protein IKX25_00295 [Bacteroidales bacterium]|nr:hypothetical protein [Bacteroidales bacterium]
MRSPKFIVLSLSLLLFLDVFACGDWASDAGNVLLYRIMPLDETDYYDYLTTWSSDQMLHRKVDYKADNLLLWQQQTSPDILLDDIERIVYRTDEDYLMRVREHPEPSDGQNNTFMRWILAQHRTDILDFLILAKQSEKVRFSMNDPWYYDVKDGYHYRVLEEVVEQCRQYTSGPLLGRYALQMVRALCTLRQYQACADYWDAIRGKLGNDAVAKMTELRAAAALYKVGRSDEAFSIYARHGDVASIRAVKGGQVGDELTFVYNLDPNSPYLEGELQKWLLYFGTYRASDLRPNGYYSSYEKYISLRDLAHRAVKEKKSRQLAMWYYVLAALYDMNGESRKAMQYLAQGQRYPKDPYLRDTYHVLRIWLDAQTSTYDEAYELRLLNDLRWLAAKIKREATPELCRKLDEYNDKTGCCEDGCWEIYQCVSNTFYWNDALRRILFKVVCPRMHEAGRYVREIQLANMAENLLVQPRGYSGEMFMIMDRLSYADTRAYYMRIHQPEDDFDRFLNNRSKTDRYFWYDVLATKCLRERRYATACYYLRKLPLSFQQTLNVYPYMTRDPFSYDMQIFPHDASLAPDYKLHFAEAMMRYQNDMRHHRDPNKRADAKIQYALGLRNSVHRCWFLTRHSSSCDHAYIQGLLPEIAYVEDSTIYRHKQYIELSEKLIQEAIRTYTDKEQAAQQLRRLLRFQRIMDSYGETATAHDIRAHCDKWRDYAPAITSL